MQAFTKRKTVVAGVQRSGPSQLPSGILTEFAVMRWLIIALLVSLGALLFAAAGMARHIWVQRAKLRRKPPAGAGHAVGVREETDLESEL
jgi:hypothetical protein